MPPDRGLSTGSAHGLKSKKDRITVGLTVNSDGSEKLEPIFIGHAERPRCFSRKHGWEHGFIYYHNKKAWMNHTIFQHWILGVNLKFAAQNRRILLWLDNFAGHNLPEEGLSHIQAEFFSPNLTPHVQPLDAGIIKSLKTNYKQRFISRAIRLFDTGTLVTSELYLIDQLTAMRMVVKSWEAVSAQTIRHCWKHTRIIEGHNKGYDRLYFCIDVVLYFVLDADIERGVFNIIQLFVCRPSLGPCVDPSGGEAEVQLEERIQTLEDIGAVSRMNRMSLDEILNPEGELENQWELWKAEELFNQRQKETAAEAAESLEAEALEFHIDRPTSKEALGLMVKLMNYLEADDSPISDQLEGMLTKYSAHVRSHLTKTANQSSLTDYFKSS